MRNINKVIVGVAVGLVAFLSQSSGVKATDIQRYGSAENAVEPQNYKDLAINATYDTNQATSKPTPTYVSKPTSYTSKPTPTYGSKPSPKPTYIYTSKPTPTYVSKPTSYTSKPTPKATPTYTSKPTPKLTPKFTPTYTPKSTPKSNIQTSNIINSITQFFSGLFGR